MIVKTNLFASKKFSRDLWNRSCFDCEVVLKKFNRFLWIVTMKLFFALTTVQDSELNWLILRSKEFNRSMRSVEWFFLFSRIDRLFRSKIRRFESLLLRSWMILVFWSMIKWVETDQCRFIFTTKMTRVSIY